MTGQFSHWTPTDIRDRWWSGMYPVDIARRTGRTVREVLDILAHKELAA